MKPLEAAHILRERFGDGVSSPVEFRGEVTVKVPPASLATIAAFCRGELGFDYLVDITSVDHLDQDPRFEVVYELAALETWDHLRLKTTASEDSPELPTVCHIWPTADWHEREIFDMMGIQFVGHPDLRRILMWEGYPHHPLRKDFPLEGAPTEVPDVAFTSPAPLAGGPFVTAPTTADTRLREPRARRPGDSPEEPSP
ncbi:MAG: NADH-quinone oxidoreductase subunit C [Terrimicrobiaceae bacterium]|nr:NADH-quinone oxidoreductase subunit C [Terrimicrobiaceae bacterium]